MSSDESAGEAEPEERYYEEGDDEEASGRPSP
jgi:hypothetical protein